MSTITLTELELEALVKLVNEEIGGYNVPDRLVKACCSVVDKAEEYCRELDAFDEIGDSLVEWYYNRYLEQQSKAE